MRNSIVTLTTPEIAQVDGGIDRETLAAGIIGLFAGLAYNKITTSSIYSPDLVGKTIGILKEAALAIILITGSIMSVNFLKRKLE